MVSLFCGWFAVALGYGGFHGVHLWCPSFRGSMHLLMGAKFLQFVLYMCATVYVFYQDQVSFFGFFAGVVLFYLQYLVYWIWRGGCLWPQL